MTYENDFTPEINPWEDQDKKNQLDSIRTDRLIEKLVELELDIEHNNWARQQPIIKELKSLGATNIQKRLFDHVCQYLGYDLGSVAGNKIRSMGMSKLRKKAFAQKTDFLVPGFIADKRDVVLWGGAGTGKTLISLMMVMAMLRGESFGDQTQACHHKEKKILFIGSDGGVSAMGVLGDYLQKMGVLDDAKLDDYFDYWVADEEEGIPSWNLSTGNLVKLKETVSSGDYALVIIDSLKAVCSNSNWSIDERSIGDVMRLVQAIVCEHSALAWIHHTNKGKSNGADKAGGVTDVIELTSANIQFKKQWDDEDQKTQTSSIVVHKLRGEMSRSFDYEFDWSGITVLEESEDDDEAVAELTGKKSDLPQAIMIAIRDSEYSRLKLASLETLFPANSRSAITKALASLRDDGYLRNEKGGWALTKSGTATAHKLGTAAFNKLTNAPVDYHDF